MSFSGASDGATSSADATGPSTPTSSGTRVQNAWQSVKTNFKAKTSMPDLKRWLSSPRASESNSQGEERHPKDKEESLFCESLLGLMQRTGRFDYLDYSKDGSDQKGKAGLEVAEKDVRRPPKRFSWSR